MDLDLEADLGKIDTVKRPNCLPPSRTNYGIPRRERPASFRLQQPHQSHQIRGRRPVLSSPAPRFLLPQPFSLLKNTPPRFAEEASAALFSSRFDADIQAFVMAVVSEKTGYPSRDARPGPRPGSRFGHRYSQASRIVCYYPHPLRHPPARRPAFIGITTT